MTGLPRTCAPSLFSMWYFSSAPRMLYVLVPETAPILTSMHTQLLRRCIPPVVRRLPTPCLRLCSFLLDLHLPMVSKQTLCTRVPLSSIQCTRRSGQELIWNSSPIGRRTTIGRRSPIAFTGVFFKPFPRRSRIAKTPNAYCYGPEIN